MFVALTQYIAKNGGRVVKPLFISATGRTTTTTYDQMNVRDRLFEV